MSSHQPDQPAHRRPAVYPSPAGPVPYPYPYQQGPIQAPVSSLAVSSFILGLVGLVFGWCLFGIPSVFAVVFGHIALRRTAAGYESGRGMATTGLIMGYVFFIPGVVFTIWVLSVAVGHHTR